MITVKHKTNPFNKYVVSEVDFCEQTLIEVLKPFMQGSEFQHPTVVRVNTVPVLRKDWNKILSNNDVVEITAVVGAPLATVLLVANIVMLVASVAFTIYGVYKARKAMQALRAGQGQAEASPFFSVDGHANKANINNPIEVGYGRNRMWPSYIGRPYRNYLDDRIPTYRIKNTTMIQVLCLGQGDYEIHAVQIGDALIETVNGMSYEIVPPGGIAKSLSKIAYTNPDFEPVVLKQDESSPFLVMSPKGLASNVFELDIETDSDGDYTISVKLWQINDKDAIIMSDLYLSKTFQRPPTTTVGVDLLSPPHRNTFSFSSGVTSGRYGIVVKPTLCTGTITIVEVKSFLKPTIPLAYSDKTLLLVKYALNNLYDNPTKDKINVICTRKLNTYYINNDSTETVVFQPTRSIAWALYDALTAEVYGGGLPDIYIDKRSFAEVDAELSRDGLFFDSVFNQVTTVEDAAKVIAASGRAYLTYNGSRLALIRDIAKGPAEALFTTENIVEGSFSWSTELFDPTEPDAVEVGFVDSNSGQEFTKVFKSDDSASKNVQQIKLIGVSSSTNALKEAAHRLRKLQFVRDTFKFKTGMDGYIPTVGACAFLSQDLVGMGESGYITNHASGYFALSRSVTLSSGDVKGAIILRKDDGSSMGPYPIINFSDVDSNGKYSVVAIEEVDFDIDFSRTDKEPVHFVCWPGGSNIPDGMKVQIESVSPSDDGTIEIVATNYDSRVYEFDGWDFSNWEDEDFPPETNTPFVTHLKAESITTPITPEGIPYTRISWSKSYGTIAFNLYVNNVLTWSGSDSFVELPLLSGFDVSISVRATNVTLEGPPSTIILDVGKMTGGTNPNFPTNNYAFSEDGLSFWWDCVLNASVYEARIGLVGESSTTYSDWYSCGSTFFKYSKSMFKENFGHIVVTSTVGVTLLFQARAIIDNLPSAISSVNVVIPSPPAPVSVAIDQDPVQPANQDYVLHYRNRNFKWSSDIGTQVGVKYSIYGQFLNSAAPFTVANVKPWIRMATTDKFLFSTQEQSFDVRIVDGSVTPVQAKVDSFYGNGYVIRVPSLINPAGTMLPFGVFLYDLGQEHNGVFYQGMQNPGSDPFDGEVWLFNATYNDVFGKKAVYMEPSRFFALPNPTDRVKGAIVADNGWFDSTAVSYSLFDVPW